MQAATTARSDTKPRPPRKPSAPPADIGPRLTGTIVRVISAEGFGFIRCHEEGIDYYVHVSSMRDRADFEAGREVTFLAGDKRSHRKAPPASDVAAAETAEDHHA